MLIRTSFYTSFYTSIRTSMRTLFCTMLFLLIASVSHATEVYISVDDKGNRVFSDQPSKESRKHKVKEISIIPAIKIPEKTPANEPAAEMVYQSLTLTNPAPETTLTRDHLGNAKVTAKLFPDLQPTDEAVLMLNGQEIGANSSLNWQLLDIKRGEHSIQVLVRDKKSERKKISSDTLTIYVQR
jgi:hypothetical protein